MCVVSQNLCLIAGTDFYFDLQLLKSDETPQDMTGATASMQLLVADDSLTQTIDFQGGIIDAANGQMQFFLDNTETQSLLPIMTGNIITSFVSDVLVDWPDGTKEVILRAKTEVEQGRTR
jgi:hypothetical protein